MLGKFEAINGNEQFKGYFVGQHNVDAPGIILIPEIFGINEHIRSVADKYAQAGYVVLAPDLFWRFKPGIELGYEGKDLEEAFKYFQEYKDDWALEDLGGAIEFLRKHKGCNGQVALLGFCLGGKLAFRTAANHKVDASISYYGVSLENHLAEADKVKCPIIFHFGALDAFVPPDTIKQLEFEYAKHANFSMYVYEGADHGFNCDARGSYQRESAELAFSRNMEFLANAGLKPVVTSRAR